MKASTISLPFLLAGALLLPSGSTVQEYAGESAGILNPAPFVPEAPPPPPLPDLLLNDEANRAIQAGKAIGERSCKPSATLGQAVEYAFGQCIPDFGGGEETGT